ncbi:hypothetical protein FB45DRAFT_914347 [Roridomyces roridus]|uniref:Crossover junction endonuclease EME1 n=1 Tax=Roridomyces roridus TaxID=1738132 RepID=A0AAD7BXH4_9AGAR|nr:hypothetical protein FB45DRAFT_914347 [Roridomyces roridus]
MADVIDITSDSDEDLYSRPTSQLSSDFVDLCDDSDDERPAPPSSQMTIHEPVDLCSSDDESPAPSDPRFLQGVQQAKRKRGTIRKAGSSSANYDVDSDEDESPKKMARNSGRSSSESSEDEEHAPAKVARKKSTGTTKKAPRKPRQTEEEKAAAKTLKQQEAAQKKRDKETLKAAKAAKAAKEKEAKKQYKAVNKLVHNKKDTLASMEIIFPPVTGHPELQVLFEAFKEKVAEYKMTVSKSGRQKVQGYNVFSWRREETAEYDPVAREFHPVPSRMKVEGTYLVYMSADELVRCIREEDGVKNVVRRVREVCGPDRVQVFIMTHGLSAYYRRAGSGRLTKSQIEGHLAALQMAEHVHLLHIDKPEDAAARLYDLSADLGIKQHKLIQRSHLPFCSDTHQTTGATQKDTMVQMMRQVHRVTRDGAEGIVERHKTMARLYQAYERDPGQRDNVVKNCIVQHRVDGVASSREIGKALSRVVGTVLYGRDPLELAYKGTD